MREGNWSKWHRNSPSFAAFWYLGRFSCEISTGVVRRFSMDTYPRHPSHPPVIPLEDRWDSESRKAFRRKGDVWGPPNTDPHSPGVWMSRVGKINHAFPKDPITLSEDDWGVQSPPKCKVFWFHYHSQKVIGSLGIWMFRVTWRIIPGLVSN